MDIFESLGVQTIVNAAGPLTRLSGTPLAPEVAAAMADAACRCVRVDELQEAAGRYLAEVTGAEAGYVTPGAAAGMVLAAAACIAGMDVAIMDRLPDTAGLRNEIVIQRAHLTAYTRALRVPGARLIEVGYLGYPGQGATWPWQIEAAIGDRTVAAAFSFGDFPGAVGLPEVVEVAHRHHVPVIVDGAAALPPADNLRRLIDVGADLVAFSGGKTIGGPQASGILVGRRELIESVALQHQDMDVNPKTWPWRERYLTSGRLAGPPHHGIGRPMKVGKEEIAGLVTAVRRYVAASEASIHADQSARLRRIADVLCDLPGVQTCIQTFYGLPLLVVRIAETVVGKTPETVVATLLAGQPPVAVSQDLLDQHAVGVIASTLQPGEEAIVAERLRQLLVSA